MCLCPWIIWHHMTSHTWLQRWNVTLKMLLSWCPSCSLWDPQLNTHPIPIQWALCLYDRCVWIFFVLETFWLGGLCYWSLDPYELCKVFSTKVLIDLQTEALFAHPAGKLALLFEKLIALTEAEAKLSSGYIRCTKILIAMYLLSNTLMLHVLLWFLFLFCSVLKNWWICIL